MHHNTVSWFPLLSLPLHLQEQILSLLPISTLLRLLPVARSLRSLLRSPLFPSIPPDLFFLLFSPRSPPFPLPSSFSSVAAFHPLSNRWIPLPLQFSHLSRPHASASSLAISERNGGELVAVRLISNSPPPPPRLIPPMIPMNRPYVLAVVPDCADRHHFKVVAVSTGEDRVYSQVIEYFARVPLIEYSFADVSLVASRDVKVYDSRTGKWVLTGQINCRFVVLGNTALLDHILYVHGYGPNRLLEFNLISNHWRLHLPMPDNMNSSHIFVSEKNLFLIAGMDHFGLISEIRVWELDWHGMKWRDLSSLSFEDELFQGFAGESGCLFHFEAVDRAGKVCLFNSLESRVLMFDVRVVSWILLPDCHLIPREKRNWYGISVELGGEMLRQSDGTNDTS